MTQNTKQALPKVAEPTFNDLGLAPKILAVLAQQNFTIPTPIQHQSIAAILEGKDLIGIAQTGTGKTLAFGLPMIQRLGQLKGQGLIMVPTRELALQVDEVLQRVGGPLGLRTAVIIGGASMIHQLKMLRRTPHVIVATPGRLVDHLQQKTISLQNTKVIVLDEADRMLDIGFAPQIKQVLDMAPKERQILLFSATMPQAIAQIAAKYMTMPLRIEVAPAGTSATNVEQEVFIVGRNAKIQLLDKLLTENDGTTLVFSRTKHGARKIAEALCSMGYTAVEIHSNRSLAQRRAALDGFKSGKYRVLVATDIAARGIDVKDICLVVNYDLPECSDDYVHRIGRTGRAGKSGKAVSFATPDQRASISQIEKLIRKTLPIIGVGNLPAPRVTVSERFPKKEFNSPRRNRRQGGYVKTHPKFY